MSLQVAKMDKKTLNKLILPHMPNEKRVDHWQELNYLAACLININANKL